MKHFLASLALALSIGFGGAVNAAEYRRFARADFEAAQAAGRPILVDVAAWWCPTCASQKGSIKAAAADATFAKLIIYRLDYDKQKSDWKRFGVQRQSTLIAFKGTKETGRSVGDTDKARIQALMKSAAQ